MGGPGHEVQLAVPQVFHGLGHRKDQLQFYVQALSFEEPKLDCRHRGKI